MIEFKPQAGWLQRECRLASLYYEISRKLAIVSNEAALRRVLAVVDAELSRK